MITADTSSWVAYLNNVSGDDILLLDSALQGGHLSMVPVVLTELLSDPQLPSTAADNLIALPLIAVETGFWQRAGVLRAKVLAKGCKARLADSLIAQTCVDADMPLITRDRDFRHFAAVSRLRILP